MFCISLLKNCIDTEITDMIEFFEHIRKVRTSMHYRRAVILRLYIQISILSIYNNSSFCSLKYLLNSCIPESLCIKFTGE